MEASELSINTLFDTHQNSIQFFLQNLGKYISESDDK